MDKIKSKNNFTIYEWGYLISIVLFLIPIVFSIPYFMQYILVVIKPDVDTSLLTVYYIIAFFWNLACSIFLITMVTSLNENDENKKIKKVIIWGLIAIFVPLLTYLFSEKVVAVSYKLYAILIFGPSIPISVKLSCYIIFNKDLILENKSKIFVGLITFFLGNTTLLQLLYSVLQKQ